MLASRDSNLEYLLNVKVTVHYMYIVRVIFYMETPFPKGILTGEANVEMSGGLNTKYILAGFGPCSYQIFYSDPLCGKQVCLSHLK